jgi:hypothetical protein
MLKIKKILSIMLGVCFLLSVTASAVSAAPFSNAGFNNHNVGFDNHKNDFNKFDNHKNKHYKPGHWGYKKTRHGKDRYHKSFWYSNDKFWTPGYWY